MKEKREIALITRGEWVKRKPFPNLKESGKLPPERVPAYWLTRAGGDQGGLGEQNQRDVLQRPLPQAAEIC